MYGSLCILPCYLTTQFSLHTSYSVSFLYSPSRPLQAELTFSAGDIIYVLGDMDADGFFYVSGCSGELACFFSRFSTAPFQNLRLK